MSNRLSFFSDPNPTPNLLWVIGYPFVSSASINETTRASLLASRVKFYTFDSPWSWKAWNRPSRESISMTKIFKHYKLVLSCCLTLFFKSQVLKFQTPLLDVLLCYSGWTVLSALFPNQHTAAFQTIVLEILRVPGVSQYHLHVMLKRIQLWIWIDLTVSLVCAVQKRLGYVWHFTQVFLFMIFIFSIVVSLQCSVSFYCTAKWPSHTYIILFLTLSSIMLHHKWLYVVPCALQQDSIAYPLQSQQSASVNPRFPVHPALFPSLLATQVLSLSPWVSSLWKVPFVPYIRFQI